MPRKKKREGNIEGIAPPASDNEQHLYVKGDVPDGFDVPVFDIYFKFSEEDFEEKVRERIKEADKNSCTTFKQNN